MASKKRASASKVTASQVLDALKSSTKFPSGAHGWLREVRNGTGYRRRERYCDGLVISFWPSRGIWVGGIEVKVARKDWLKELKNPEKSHEIQKYCNHWWVAAPEGIVDKSEVPKQWGYLEVRGKKVVEVVAAPDLKPDPWDAGFVASVLRRLAQNQEEAFAQVRDDYRAKLEESARVSGDEDAQLIIQNRKLKHQVRALESQAKRHENYRAIVHDFERKMGVPEGSITNGQIDPWFEGKASNAPLFKVLRKLQEQGPAGMVSDLREAANRIENLMLGDDDD